MSGLPRRERSPLRTTAGLLALAFLLSLGPTGAGATHESVGDTVELGLGGTDECFANPACAPFAGIGQSCKPEVADLLDKGPFVSIEDIAPYTATRTRQAKFKLVSSEALGEGARRLVVFVRTAACTEPTSGNAAGGKELRVGDEVTLTIAQGTKWFIVSAANRNNPFLFHHNEVWRLTFLH